MSPTIRIDDEVYERLKAHAEPFVDTPNTVLRRLLQLSPMSEAAGEDELVSGKVDAQTSTAANADKRTGAKAKAKKTRPKEAPKRKRAPRGSLLPEAEYDVPLLRTLQEHGGSASFKDVVAGVGEKLGEKLTDLDRAKLSSGAVRWENRLQFVRLRLIESGLMEKDSPRGVWAITDAGLELLSGHLSVVA